MQRWAVKITCWLTHLLLSLLIVSTFPSHAAAQVITDVGSSVSETLDVHAGKGQTWHSGDENGGEDIIRLEGPVFIGADHAVLKADNAVAWFTPVPGSVLGEQRVDVSLVGNASVQQDGNTRSGDALLVTLNVRGAIRLTVDERTTDNRSDSPLYQQAALLRPTDHFPTGTAPVNPALLQQPPPPPTTVPATQPVPKSPITIICPSIQTVTTPDNKLAVVLSNGVTLLQTRPNGDYIECQADRAVLFTARSSLRELAGTKGFDTPESAVESVFLEGDVRITFTPSPPDKPGQKPKGEERLRGNRVYYDFTTDRAVLTDAVVHTVDPDLNIPLIVRARLVRQMSVGEFQADKTQLSSSSFATPSYSIGADRAYVREIDTGDPRLEVETQFVAHDATFQAYNIPYFYLPTMAGNFTQKGSPLRSIYTESSSRFGTGVRSTFGLFETLGILPPEDLDLSFHLDYLNDRGFGTGLDGTYQGGFIDENTKDPWDFDGRFTSYLVNDHGYDRLGADRNDVDPDRNIRGKLLWEHQHFFPDDWQAQLRFGYLSDPTFLEEWYQNEFDTAQPYDASAYLKHQKDTEAFTFLLEGPTRNFVTVADQLQENTQVERYPEIGYRRIGDSFAGDNLTFYSENSLSALGFDRSRTTPADIGFQTGDTPGIPSYAETGVDSTTTFRGDTRQEVDYPVQLGQLKVMPFVFGRYTGYSDSPTNDNQQRLFAGTGVRINTAFWRVDDSAYSQLWDINRVRHVIEPEINLFTSGSTVQRDQVFDYDEDVDKINDVSAAQFALHQSWQTKRGGAGLFRSVDFFTFNVEMNLFNHQPTSTTDLLAPRGFRGLYFPSEPEDSIPRNSINADSLWRVSDSTALLADEQYNLDANELATASVGLAVQREDRVAYFLGLRYIGQLNSTVASVSTSYQVSLRYNVAVNESIDVGTQRSENSSFTLTRHFDRFFASLTLYYDQINRESGFRFGFVPEGLGKGVSSDEVSNSLATR